MVHGAAVACVLAAWGMPFFSAPTEPITFEFSRLYGSTEKSEATATVDMSFFSDGVNTLVGLDVVNTTSSLLDSSLTALGLELPDTFDWQVRLVSADSYLNELTFNDKVSPSWMDAAGGYDIMLTSDGKFEGGSAKGAPRAGQSQYLLLSLGNTVWSAEEMRSIFIDYYQNTDDHYAVARFQEIGKWGGSDKMLGAIIPTTPVPEPASAALIAGGWLVIHVRRRR